MANRFIEVWSNSVTNAEIAASGRYIFGTETSDTQNRKEYGSMNFFIFRNGSAVDVKVIMDGQDYVVVGNGSSLVISAEDGFFFDLIEIENQSGAAVVAAGTLNLRYGRARPL